MGHVGEKGGKRRPSILVIDDDELVRATLRAAFEGAGYGVTEAGDGEEGVAVLRSTPIDLVFCDIFMPGMEGIETIRMMREWRPGVRIVAMSGGGQRGELGFLEIAKKLGADEALAKPFRLAEALSLADAALAP